ncbi:MAG: adenylate/guanylate cyclase domain-containing protein [Pelagibacterales bacterium]|jgi:class 3 adenylate cyclase|nr:adenylate/guanylate cyclase domain-containing protein [Pelagibacterales bacterium]
MERVEKELNFYKKRCNDLGAKVFKLGEDLSWAKTNTRRYQTTASIIQTAHNSISLNDNIKAASLNFLKIIIEKMNVDKAILLLHKKGKYEFFYSLGNNNNTNDNELKDLRLNEFGFANSRSTDDAKNLQLISILNQPYYLFSSSVENNFSLIISKDSEDLRIRPAFTKDDKPVIEGALSVFIDIYKRKIAEDLLTTQATTFSKYVPTQFLKFLDKESIINVEPGDVCQEEMTVLFSDIRSFTTLSEKMSPNQNFKFLNKYFSSIGPIIRKHNGFIDKYIGDAIMALFPNKVDDAISCAIEMQDCVNKLRKTLSNKYFSELTIGIGLHSGKLMLGIIGEEERLQGTVISDAVNLASRIEGLTKILGASIITSKKMIKETSKKSKFIYRELGIVKVRGREQIVEIVEILNGISGKTYKKRLETKELFEQGVEYFSNKDFEKSFELFDNVLKMDASDIAAKYYLGRSNIILNNMYEL